MKILVTYATQDEFVEINWENVQVHYLQTGIGKTKSTFHLFEAIEQIHPELVINVGTAGTVKHQIGDLFVCRHFIDRDMQKLANYGVDFDINLPKLKTKFIPDCLMTHDGICNTGDTFLTKNDEVIGDIIDMEAYAQAFVCYNKQVPFIAVKYVTDVIGQNSVEIWQDKLREATDALFLFLNNKKAE